MARSNPGATGGLVVAAAFLATFAGGDSTGRVVLRPRAITTTGTPRTETPEERALQEQHTRFGIPKPDPAFGHGEIFVVTRDAYVLGHSSLMKTPYWVCETLDLPALRQKDRERLEKPFKADELLPPGGRAEYEDYQGFRDIYDRGHMMPDADRTLNPLKEQTYFLSNAVPQVSSLNRGLWAQLEGRARQWACSGRQLWVITGPIWYDPEEDDPVAEDFSIPHSVIGRNGVAVPTHVFKIILSVKTARPGVPEDMQTLAFVMPNEIDPSKKKPFANYVKSIDWIESHSGFDFFPDLPAAHQSRLETETHWRLWEVDKNCADQN